jgi:hypothetical protein
MTQELRSKLEQIPYTYIDKIIDWLNNVNKSSTDFSLAENNKFYIFEIGAIFTDQSPHISIWTNKHDTITTNAVYYVDFPELGNGKAFRQLIYGDAESIDKVIDKAIEELREISLKTQRREYLYRLLFLKDFDGMEGLKIYHNSNDNYDIIYNLNVRELEYAISKLQDFTELNPNVSTYLITIRENECYIKFDETDADNNIINAFYLIHAKNNQDFPNVYKFTHDWATFETNRDVVINRFQNILEKKERDQKRISMSEAVVETDSHKFPIPTVNLKLVINDGTSIQLPSDVVDIIIKQLVKQVNAKKIPNVISYYNVKDWTITGNNEIEWKSSVSLESILTNSIIKLEFEK